MALEAPAARFLTALLPCRSPESVWCGDTDAVTAAPIAPCTGQVASAPPLVWQPDGPVDIAALLGSLSRGASDPTQRRTPDGAVWRACATPDGPGTVRVRLVLPPHGPAYVEAWAWGPGGRWLLDRVPASLGAADDASGFSPCHPVLVGAARRHAVPRLPRSECLMEALVTAILEQKVTSSEARRSWRELVTRYGTPAPGPAPAGLYVPPAAGTWRAIPSWGWHAAGVDTKRAAAIVASSRVAGRLEEALTVVLTTRPVAGLAPDGAAADDLLTRRLRSVPGIGPWTIAEARQRACGDADALSVGDYHLATEVGWALCGRPIDDAEMVRVLAPYSGHRYRAVRLLQLVAPRRPRFAPRFAPVDHRAI